MAGYKHLVLVKFKDGADVDRLLKGLENHVHEMDIVKAYVWGEDKETSEICTQGFTHVLLMSFDSMEDVAAFITDAKHLEFSITFAAAIKKSIVLDFPQITVKPPPPAAAAAAAAN